METQSCSSDAGLARSASWKLVNSVANQPLHLWWMWCQVTWPHSRGCVCVNQSGPMPPTCVYWSRQHWQEVKRQNRKWSEQKHLLHEINWPCRTGESLQECLTDRCVNQSHAADVTPPQKPKQTWWVTGSKADLYTISQQVIRNTPEQKQPGILLPPSPSEPTQLPLSALHHFLWFGECTTFPKQTERLIEDLHVK